MGLRSVCRGNVPDEDMIAMAGNEDVEYYRYRQMAAAVYRNNLRVQLTTLAHPMGLLDGNSTAGPPGPEWPMPSL
jgi:hypothetical protein